MSKLVNENVHERFIPMSSIDFYLTFGKLKSWGTVVKLIQIHKHLNVRTFLVLNSINGKLTIVAVVNRCQDMATQ